jgi:hypothetical protein
LVEHFGVTLFDEVLGSLYFLNGQLRDREFIGFLCHLNKTL